MSAPDDVRYLPETLEREIDRYVTERQVESRIPGLLVGVARRGRLVWSSGVGVSDVARGTALTRDTQFAIGSITKTFTATLIMALRDEGKLDLDDRLTDFVPETKHATLTLRRMLAHASGLQREPVGDVWDTLQHPDTAHLLKGLEEADQVLPPRLRWHYSNLAYSVLGEVVARVDGRSWGKALRKRILEPLEMKRTMLMPEGEAAVGYFTEPFTDSIQVQPVSDLKALAPAGALWSTLEDLMRWADFLAQGDDMVLADDTLAEMAQVQIMADPRAWSLAWGLGLELFRCGDRVLVGHTGGMPGFLTAVVIERESRTGTVVLANAIGDFDPGDVACHITTTVLDRDPPSQPAWRPGPPVAADLVPLVGRWWSEGTPFEFFVRNGQLHARAEKAPTSQPPAVFERIDATTFRTVRGREQGELLRLTYEGDDVTLLHWATYRVTREPESFGDHA